ncbi:unnamed protein product [Schistosoma mattheei]|uniref:Inositol hexakisphosphate and diphosphoinositol-pentakisphosphate kinase n=1 Tax=Schistosoma mattheei TaxID=31246 RepID=A0AA85AXX4_9TREM|nr:unnamed protein product [Schistosoma mattheei]
MGERTDDNDVVVTIGVCAMAKKAMSKPMKEILRRMDKFQHIKIIIFDEKMILDSPIESWPICDALVSFYSEGFPLKKAIAYSKLRKPYLVNDLESQYILMDRRRVYECLMREGVPVPRYAFVDRTSENPVKVVELDDSIEINGEVFHKPFVEKPLHAEDHNIYIYFPSSAGGGSQRLFRKVGNRSSKYFPHSNIRTNGSYMYEEFMPTDGTDVKVYTVADDYAHAEARKSPALDGKVERDHEGKEVRYPVILTPREKIIAKKVAKAVRQQICGFDLLRANGMSYVCDVNGFSFVKSSKKYYDDCSHILGVLITRKIAPRLCLPTNLPPGTDVDTPLVPTTCGAIMELRCVIAVIRHGDRTPKQKMKMEVCHQKFFSFFTKYAGGWARELKIKRPTQLQEILDIVRSILEEIDSGQCTDNCLLRIKPKFEQLKYVLEMYGSFSGINRKIQLKYQPHGIGKESKIGYSSSIPISCDCTDECDNTQPCLLVVVKWGGELTAAGKQQAETLGKAFRCIYPGGDGHYGKDPGLGLLRLHSTYRHDLKIYASDEGRVQMTAAAFAKGFLALEGELPPILVQMVKSANTNGLLDNDNDCRHYQQMVKRRINEVMSKNSDFTAEDIATLVPTGARSIINAMQYVKSPYRACGRLFEHVRLLSNRLAWLSRSSKERSRIHLYQGESWDLLLRRWGKLLKDFRSPEGEYDLSKISDIYDNIKYDLQHNSGILLESEVQDFFMCAKSLADIIVPQEYGITKEEKLVIGQRICTPLMRKILSDARYTDVDECTRLHAGYSKGVASPERFVRSRLYFTSESHIHSLLTCLRYGELADIVTDEQWRRAMEYVSSISEINYLAQIVIMIYEDPTVEPKTEKRFHVELHFSPGAFALCHDLPEGSGFRSGKLVYEFIHYNSKLTDFGEFKKYDYHEQLSFECSCSNTNSSRFAPVIQWLSKQSEHLVKSDEKCDNGDHKSNSINIEDKRVRETPKWLTLGARKLYDSAGSNNSTRINQHNSTGSVHSSKNQDLTSTSTRAHLTPLPSDEPVCPNESTQFAMDLPFNQINSQPVNNFLSSSGADSGVDDDPVINQTLNAITYPSRQSPYHLDIGRLIRETEQIYRRFSSAAPVATGAPFAPPICRSLISTAVIRGSRDDSQASSSVPDFKRLTEDISVAPRTLTPGSSQEFLVPSAPCVPEVYPLETLHNALTLSQLEAFLVRLTTHKFPTPFTSPKHPSTPVNYYHHHHQSQLSQTTLEFFSQYHDLCTNLSSSLPNSTGDDTAAQDCSNIVDEASTQLQQPVSSNVTSIIPSASPFQKITSRNTNCQQ